MHLILATLAVAFLGAQPSQGIRPVRTEVVTPIHRASFDNGGKAPQKKLVGNPRSIKGVLIFDGANDGDRQVDPQIAVGCGYVLHGTNTGLYLYSKQGEFISGVPQSEFSDGIDPKLFFDSHNKIFGFDIWCYWDKDKKKPVNISVSETVDARGAWNTYSVPAPKGVDGGGIGYSRKWIGYSFPGGSENTFVLKTADVKAGKPATVYHFAGSLGHPVYTQDAIDDLFFFELTDQEVILRRVGEARDGTPVVEAIFRRPHFIQINGGPPASPQRGTDKKTASGDRNPKNIVVQNGCAWCSQAVNFNGRSAVQWHQFRLNGVRVQSGGISHPQNSYIQTTLAVNAQEDVLVGFQETGPDLFISPRASLRRRRDAPGKTGPLVSLGEGQAATEGGPWGDYSGSVIDGDNLSDLWTIQSIANKEGHGATVVARFRMETGEKRDPRDGGTFMLQGVGSWMSPGVEKLLGGDGSKVVQVPTAKSPVWKLEKDGDHYRIVNTTNGLVLDATDEQVVLRKANGSGHQLWGFVKVGEAYQIKCKETGRVLDVSGGSSIEGTALITWPAKEPSSANQMWVLTEAKK